MSDQRPDDTTVSERSSLPPDLLPIHDRLSGDGARWRWRAPDGAGLASWARATLDYADGDGRTRRAAGHPRLRERRLDLLETSSAYPPGPKGPMRDMTSTRIRGFLGVAAAVVVVGLIALLLTRNAALHSGTGAPGSSSGATSAIPPTPSGSSSQQSTQFQQAGQLPVVAQSDPKIVYKIASGALKRSSNGGGTYTTLSLPKTDLTAISGYSVAVSPLNANAVFVTLDGLKGGQGCMASQPYPATAMHGGILASGYASCSEQYLSVDGGHTWKPLQLPMQGVLGATNGFRSPSVDPYGNDSYIFQAQGKRLYAALGYASQDGSLMASEAARLVASDDGGVTWRLIDTRLASATQLICDFAASPTGTTVYAITESTSCGNESLPSMTLWSSADGGQSWTRVQQLANLATAGFLVGAHGELYSFIAPVTAASHSYSMTDVPANAMVSVDGGVTFSGAPSAGLPPNGQLSGPYATLADGSVVYGLAYTEAYNRGPMALYSWKKGASAWTQIGSPIATGAASVTVTPPAAGATDQTVTITDVDGNISTVQVPIGQ